MDRKIYLIECNNDGYITYKIGKTSRNIKSRLKELNTGSSGVLTVIYEYQSKYASLLEKSLHRAFSHCHIKGEWYSSNLDLDEFLKCCKSYDNAIHIYKNSYDKI